MNKTGYPIARHLDIIATHRSGHLKSKSQSKLRLYKIASNESSVMESNLHVYATNALQAASTKSYTFSVHQLLKCLELIAE